MNKFQLNELKKVPLTMTQVNRKVDIKAARQPSDKHDQLRRIDNQINKLIVVIKKYPQSTQSTRYKKMLIKARRARIKVQRKLSTQG